MLATDLQDILFRPPKPIRAAVNLGVLKKDAVNIVVHGHEPVLSEMIVAASRDPELLKMAESQGAKGINIAGICCTANEILMRHGVPGGRQFPAAGTGRHYRRGGSHGRRCAVHHAVAGQPVQLLPYQSWSLPRPRTRCPALSTLTSMKCGRWNVAKDIVGRAVENYSPA